MPTPGEIECSLGMTHYLTEDLPGTGGRLKSRAEDFVVEEVPLAFTRARGEGKYTIASLRVKNWETNRLVRELANRLGLSRQSIFFAGTKDKRAVTTQYVSLRTPLEAVRALDLRDVEILDAFRVDRAPKIGELAGNRFDIKIREFGIPVREAEERATAILDKLRSHGGFPNLFGVQRFGVVRPVTHVVGERILRGNWEDAVLAYVAEPRADESSEVRAARARLGAERDWRAALSYYPSFLSFERTMIHHLADHPDDAVGAIRALPPNLAQMFVYAYQSLLFNRVVSERIGSKLPLESPLEGDIAFAVDEEGLPDREHAIPVTARNLEKMRRAAGAGRALMTGIIYGADEPYATGAQGDIERRVVRDAGAAPEWFRVPRYAEIGSHGTRREMLATLGPVTVSSVTDDVGEALRFQFFLAKGVYATSLLREVLKADASAYS
ncbi:MAG: tRNA pseudouridine(13) synthase TruD [Thermoplasmatota archaeon]